MNVLIDTHIFHWMIETPEKISKKALTLIHDTDVKLYVSEVSLWEFALLFERKRKNFKTKLQLAEFLEKGIKRNNIRQLPITPAHAQAYLDLTLVPGHNDQYDRMILAQAIATKYPIISADSYFPEYSDKIQLIWD